MQNLTDRSVLQRLCREYDISPSKGFGQNFITNPALCPQICEAAGIGPDSNVLEIGPGVGTLTVELARRAKKVVALELDKRLLPVLDETLKDYTNITLRAADAMKVDFAALLQEEFDGPALLCANLPYNITSPLIMKLLEGHLPLTQLTVMVQKEAADRLTAPPGTRASGAISYAVAYYSQPEMLFTVAPGNFYPEPKVTSAVITLTLRPQTLLGEDPKREKRLFGLIRASFSHRRKTLANAASGSLGISKETLLNALEEMGLDTRLRPEQLTLEDFIRLEALLNP